MVSCDSVVDKMFTVYRHYTLAKYFFLHGKPERAREELSQIASVLGEMRRDSTDNSKLFQQILQLQSDTSMMINVTQAFAFFKHYAPDELTNLSKGQWSPQFKEETGYQGTKYKRYSPLYVKNPDKAPKVTEQVGQINEQHDVINTDIFSDYERSIRATFNSVLSACPIKQGTITEKNIPTQKKPS